VHAHPWVAVAGLECNRVPGPAACVCVARGLWLARGLWAACGRGGRRWWPVPGNSCKVLLGVDPSRPAADRGRPAACARPVCSLWLACGQSVRDLWAACGWPVGSLWLARGQPVRDLWAALWLARGLWLSRGLRLSRTATVAPPPLGPGVACSYTCRLP
jgi:hypothetical protein